MCWCRGLAEALIHLELAGFATCLVFAVSSRVFGRILLLRTRPTPEPWLPRLAIAWGYRPGQSGLVLVALGWSLEVQAAGVWVRWLGSLLELAALAT